MENININFNDMELEQITLGVDKIAVGVDKYLDIKVDNFSFKVFSQLVASSKSLVVFMPHALARDVSDRIYPCFARWKWGAELGVSSIVIDDPTVYAGDLQGGWFQGNEQHFALDEAVKLILGVCASNDIPTQNVILYGSSLGGFAALMAAASIQGSIAIAEIPQTDLPNYMFTSVITSLCDIVYGSKNIAEISAKYADRFFVIERYKKLQTIPRMKLIHELSDEPNGSVQIYPFLAKLAVLAKELSHPVKDIEVQITNHGNGHVALRSYEAIPMIKAELKKHN